MFLVNFFDDLISVLMSLGLYLSDFIYLGEELFNHFSGIFGI
jgi:hypothetical protein